MVLETSDLADQSLAADDYLIELSTAPLKLYLLFSSSFAIDHGESAVSLSFRTQFLFVLVRARFELCTSLLFWNLSHTDILVYVTAKQDRQ